MTAEQEQQITVGDFAVNTPDTLPVFQKLGIDFCCGGKQLLGEVLLEKGISWDEFTALVNSERLYREKYKDTCHTDYTQMSPAVLSAYIEDTHHDYLRNVLPQIEELLHAVLIAHGKAHRELFEVYQLFGHLKADLEQHLVKEELLLFPALTQNRIPDKEVAELRKQIIQEHEKTGKLLDRLHCVTNDFSIPLDACQSFQRVYLLLEELEKDLHLHIHLENNILLKF